MITKKCICHFSFRASYDLLSGIIGVRIQIWWHHSEVWFCTEKYKMPPFGHRRRSHTFIHLEGMWRARSWVCNTHVDRLMLVDFNVCHLMFLCPISPSPFTMETWVRLQQTGFSWRIELCVAHPRVSPCKGVGPVLGCTMLITLRI